MRQHTVRLSVTEARRLGAEGTYKYLYYLAERARPSPYGVIPVSESYVCGGKLCIDFRPLMHDEWMTGHDTAFLLDAA